LLGGFEPDVLPDGAERVASAAAVDARPQALDATERDRHADKPRNARRIRGHGDDPHVHDERHGTVELADHRGLLLGRCGFADGRR
jgi:hypothetical protein